MEYIEMGNDKVYKSFKKAYLKAEAEHLKSYIWEGHEFLPAYSKYVLQYSEDRRARGGMKILFQSKDGKLILRMPKKSELAGLIL